MTILVTGATGHVGRHVVDQLIQAGHQVRALTRDPARAALPVGVEAVAGEMARTETLERAFDGVSAAHLINFGGPDYRPLSNGPEIVALAERAGVRRVSLLGGWDEGTLEPAVKASALEWTYVQASEFMSNALDWAEEIRTAGTLSAPFGATRTPMVHEADIAAVAVAALTGEGHAGQTYFLTGPELLDLPEKLSAISAATGRELRYVPLTEEQAREKWAKEGVAPEMADFYVTIFGTPPWGPYTVSPAVEQVTGRPGRTFAQWARENAASFQP